MLPYFSIGSLQVFTYPLVLGILLGLSYVYSKNLQAIKNNLIPSFNFYFVCCFLSAWLGAKLVFLLSIDQTLAVRAIGKENFWLGGGFVFYGGLIFGFLFTTLYKYSRNIPWKSFEFIIPVLAISHSIGRVGCFLAGCCFGGYCDLPWAIVTIGDAIQRHPVQLYEAGLLFIGFIIFLKRYKSSKSIIVEYAIFYACIRFVLEFFRGDQIRGVYAYGMSTSQIISISILMILSVYKGNLFFRNLPR